MSQLCKCNIGQPDLLNFDNRQLIRKQNTLTLASQKKRLSLSLKLIFTEYTLPRKVIELEYQIFNCQVKQDFEMALGICRCFEFLIELDLDA